MWEGGQGTCDGELAAQKGAREDMGVMVVAAGRRGEEGWQVMGSLADALHPSCP